MARISELARSLMGGQDGDPPPPEGGLGPLLQSLGGEGPDPAGLKALLGAAGSGDRNERALLEAMKPFLSEKRRARMDRALQIARLSRLARLALEQTGGDAGEPL